MRKVQHYQSHISSSNMNTTYKVLSVVLVVAIATIAVLGLYLPNSGFTVGGVTVATSSDQTTNSTAKTATVTISPATASATSTVSLLNTDSVDRVIIGTEVFCSNVGSSKTYLTGTGLASFLLRAATTSSSSVGLQGNTNYAAQITVSTSTDLFYIASSTEGVLQYVSRIWPTNTYLTFNFNATNTAACTVGSRYFLI